ncbi:SPOR domain-containing protein [Aestuariivirga sp.]|uniref:SPOR domain-containing protein n=1 Tax=Aestuariivirga sp. TaxID=2650926 RepID=UPI0039E6EA5F
MDQNSTNGTGSDKRNWRDRLGIGTRDMPKISDEFKQDTPAAKPAPRAPQPVTKPAPMAPRVPSSKSPAQPTVSRSSRAEAPEQRRVEPTISDPLAERLKAQRAAAERLAEQRVSAARERAESRIAATTPKQEPPPARADVKPAAVPPAAAKTNGDASGRPKFTFADDAGTLRREPPAPNGGSRATPSSPLLPPRPALAGERQPSLLRPSTYRSDPPQPAYRPIDPATGYTTPRQPSLGTPRGYAQDAAAYEAGRSLTRKASGYDAYRGLEGEEPPRGDPRLGRSVTARSRLPEPEGDDVFEDEAPQPPRRRASATEYHSAYREAEEEFDDRRRSSGPWLILLALLLCAAAVAGGFYYYNTHMKQQTATTGTTGTGDGVPVIAAPETPAKTEAQQPAATGGDTAAVNKKQIYDRIVGDQEVTAGSKVVPTEVTPIQPDTTTTTDQSAQPDTTNSTGQSGTDDTAPLPLPPAPGTGDGKQGAIDQTNGNVVATAATPPTAIPEPIKVPGDTGGTAAPSGSENTAALLPDTGTTDGGSADTSQAQPSTAKAPAAAKPDTTAASTDDSATAGTEAISDSAPAATAPKKATAEKHAASTSTTKKKIAAAAKTGEPVVLVPQATDTAASTVSPSQTGGTDVAAAPALTETAAPVDAQPKKKKTLLDLFNGSNSSSSQEKTVAVEPVPDAPAATAKTQQVATIQDTQTTASTTGAGYIVKLSSFRSMSEAQSEYNRLRSKYSTVSGLSSNISQSSLAGSTRYRLALGPVQSRDAAAQVCNQLIAGGERDCIVSHQ